MRCNRCGAENAPESRFSQQCGAELSGMAGMMSPQGMMTSGYGMPPMQKKSNNTLWIILASVGSPTTSTRAPMPKRKVPVGGNLYQIRQPNAAQAR